MAENNIPKINNSRKISELRGREGLAYHQEHSWLAVAQYNSMIGAYHNIAVNIGAITSYSINAANEISSYIVDTKLEEFAEAYRMGYVLSLTYVIDGTDYDTTSYYISNAPIAETLTTYIHSYTMDSVAWEYYPAKEYNNVKINYLTGEDGQYLLTDKGKKIRVD